jgi:hypothetical protein
MDEIRLIDAGKLKTDLKQYFSDGTLDSVSAKLAFNMILRKIDEAPTVTPEKKLQTPSCLTNPERQAELLERYKEE